MLVPNHVAKGELKCLWAGIVDESGHTRFYIVLGLEPRTSCMLRKHPTNWSTSTAHVKPTLNKRRLWAMDPCLQSMYMGRKKPNTWVSNMAGEEDSMPVCCYWRREILGCRFCIPWSMRIRACKCLPSRHCHCLQPYVEMPLSPSSFKSKHPSNGMAPAYKTARLRLERT